MQVALHDFQRRTIALHTDDSHDKLLKQKRFNSFGTVTGFLHRCSVPHDCSCHDLSLMQRIEFAYFDAGGGHRAAVTAIEMVIQQTQRPWDVQLTNLQELLESRISTMPCCEKDGR
jgi:hypothetical protein